MGTLLPIINLPNLGMTGSPRLQLIIQEIVNTKEQPSTIVMMCPSLIFVNLNPKLENNTLGYDRANSPVQMMKN